jgi:hypothetical protein
MTTGSCAWLANEIEKKANANNKISDFILSVYNYSKASFPLTFGKPWRFAKGSVGFVKIKG